MANEILNFDEVINALKQLEPKLNKKLTKKVLKNSAKDLLQQTKKACPVDTGALKKSLRVRAIRKSRKYVGWQVATTAEHLNQGDTYYAAAVEFRNPFMRPTFDENKRQLGNTIIDETWEEIKEALNAH